MEENKQPVNPTVPDDKAEELDLSQRIAELNEKLKKYEEKDFNFQELKRKNKIIKEKAEEEKETVEQEKQRLEQEKKTWDEQKRKDINEFQERMIKESANGDEELVKKIKYHFDNFKGEVKTPEEIKERINSARILAGTSKVNISQNFNPLANMGGATGVSTGYNAPQKTVSKLSLENNEQADLLRKFNIQYTPEKIKEIEEKVKRMYPQTWEGLDKSHSDKI